MIVDPSHLNDDDNMKQPLLGASSSSSGSNTPQDSPPSYDFATDSERAGPSSSQPTSSTHKPLIPSPSAKAAYASQSHDQTQPLLLHHGTTPGPSYAPAAPMVYNYVNPRTGEQVASLLPPDHPEMICLQEGAHVPHTQYGLLGILAAVFWFPLGIGLCLLDRRVRCRRCGQVIDDGICG